MEKDKTLESLKFSKELLEKLTGHSAYGLYPVSGFYGLYLIAESIHELTEAIKHQNSLIKTNDSKEMS